MAIPPLMAEALDELEAEYSWVDPPDDPEWSRWHPSELRTYFESDGERVPSYKALTDFRNYGEWVLPEPLQDGPPQPLGMVRLRLICFAQAGMGAWAFHGWVKKLPLWVEVCEVYQRTA